MPEVAIIDAGGAHISRNTFADIESILTTCAQNGTRFEIEYYDIAHLYTPAHFCRARGSSQSSSRASSAFSAASARIPRTWRI
jgi:uncharacterized protein (DUF849 family)